MKSGWRRWAAGWIEAARRLAFALLLVAGGAALGFLIAWPLWLFATSAREAYTVTVLALGAGGILFLVVRGVARRRSRPGDPFRPARSAVASVLATVMALVGVGGAYLAAALFARGMGVAGAAVAVVWAAALWLLGRARRAAKARKARSIAADNRSE